MSTEVETMMYAGRVKPWHGLGRSIDNAPNSEDALIYAGLDWEVIQRPIYTADGTPCQGYKANVRDSDNSVLGIVDEKYRVIQNHEAFAFTDALCEYSGAAEPPFRKIGNRESGTGNRHTDIVTFASLLA